MIGAVHNAQPASCEWTLIHTIALARFYFVDLGNVVGGSLHVVLSDGNVDTDNVEFCRDYALERKDHVGAALASCLLELSEEERVAVYDACGGF